MLNKPIPCIINYEDISLPAKMLYIFGLSATEQLRTVNMPHTILLALSINHTATTYNSLIFFDCIIELCVWNHPDLHICTWNLLSGDYSFNNLSGVKCGRREGRAVKAAKWETGPVVLHP